MAIVDRFRVKVRIMNEDYVLLSPAQPEHLERLAKLVDQRMREMTAKEPRLSITRAAVMTSMMFADQAIEQVERSRELEQELQTLQAEVARLQSEQVRQSPPKGPTRDNRKGRR